LEPLGHPLVKLLLGKSAPRLDVREAMVDLLAHIDVVLDVFQGGVFRKKFQDAQDLFFSGVHRGILAEAAAVHFTPASRPPPCRSPSLVWPFTCLFEDLPIELLAEKEAGPVAERIEKRADLLDRAKFLGFEEYAQNAQRTKT
jgi:hypothetical protein